MGAGHDHGTVSIRHERPLWWALGLTSAFLIAEVIGAWLTNSLALLSDAAHMGTDTLALVIALAAVRLSRKPPDSERTFGYVRAEAMGAMANGLLLFAVAAYILFEAIQRFRQPPEVHSGGMLLIATLGLIVNLIAMRLLKAGSEENLNLKGAYLEVWADMLGSIGVIAAAVLIYFTGWRVVDPIVAVLIGLWVLPRTWTLLREAGNVLMLGVPKGMDLEAIRAALTTHPGVDSIHDLHLWALGSSRPALMVHVTTGPEQDYDALRLALDGMLAERFDILHTTIQIERAACVTAACDARPEVHAH